MNLDTTNKSLQLKLASNVSTNQLSCVASWADMSGSTFTAGSTTSLSNNTTAVTIVSSPAAGIQRQIKNLDIYNADTAAASVTIIYNDNTSLRTLVQITLQPGEAMQFAENAWSVIDSSGRAQVATSAGSSSTAGNPWQFNVENYGAVGDGKTALVSVTTAGVGKTITGPSGTWTSADVNKHIMINGAAGSTSAPLVTTIDTFVSDTSVVLHDAVSVTASDCAAVWGTDDTSAINSAVSSAKTYALANNYTAEVLFQDKIYILASGPTQSTSPAVYNAQIPVPYPDQGGGSRKLTIAFTGAGDAGFAQFWESTTPNLAGTSLVSMTTAPSTASSIYFNQSVIGGPSGSSGFTGGYANTKVVVTNLQVVCGAYTNQYAYDFANLTSMHVDASSALIFAPSGYGGGAGPLLKDITSHTNFKNALGTGLRAPLTGNNDDITVPSFTAEGYSNGLYIFDHFTANRIMTFYTNVGIHIDLTQGITGGGHRVSIPNYSCEVTNGGILSHGSSGTGAGGGGSHGNGNMTPVFINMDCESINPLYDVKDDGNVLFGVIRWTDPADSRNMVVSGGANLTIHNDYNNTNQFSGAVIPHVVNLTDATTISIDAYQGNDYRVTLAGNRTLGNPSNPSDGQHITLEVTQGSGGSHTLSPPSSASAFDLGTATGFSLSTTAGKADVLQFVYNATSSKWRYLGSVLGFASSGGGGSSGDTVFGQPSSPATLTSDTAGYTLGMEFTLTANKTMTGIWFYSASGAGALPSACAIYTIAGTPAIVTGSSQTAPSWSGAAGSGWVHCAYSPGVSLTSGTAYKVVVQYAGGSNWYSSTSGYWTTGGAGASGLTSTGGFITAPNNASATGGGQDTYTTPSSALTYPSTTFGSANYWVDVEVA